MKYLLYMIFLLVVLMTIFLFYTDAFDGRKQSSDNNQQTEQEASDVLDRWETKTDDQLPVVVKVTPVELGKNDQLWKFNIAFDTHSGSLDENLAEAVTLNDDKGNAYQSTLWEEIGSGSHHREGILSFNPIIPAPAYVELKVENVGGIPRRSFMWNLK